MRCKTCDYPLWNLTARDCPECGAHFQPSDFDFVHGSVRFCCPDCRQAYYGTGQRGQLVPDAFDCVSCGRPLRMDDMVLIPAEGVTEGQTSRDVMPWFERRDRGLLRAWFGTISVAMSRPAGLIRAVPGTTSVGTSWMFMFCSNVLYLMVGQFIPGIAIALLLVAGMQGFAAPGMGRMLMLSSLPMVFATLVGLAILPLIWVVLAHLGLMLFGAARAPFSRTAHSIYYSSAASALAAVPLCDCTRLIGRVWWLVSATLMVQESHRCRGWQAAVAVTGSGVIVGMMYLGAIVSISLTMMGGIIGSNPTGLGTVETQSVTSAIIAYAQNDGEGPRHAIRLITGSNVTTAHFVSPWSSIDEADVPVGEMTLKDLAFLPSNRREAAVQAAEAAVPDGVVAHRLGDFVFAYHGADLRVADPQLWVVILLPAPGTGVSPPGTETVFVGLGDGSVRQFPLTMLGLKLAEQNGHRESIGLPSLPDLSTVAHEAPAFE